MILTQFRPFEYNVISISIYTSITLLTFNITYMYIFWVKIADTTKAKIYFIPLPPPKKKTDMLLL